MVARAYHSGGLSLYSNSLRFSTLGIRAGAQMRGYFVGAMAALIAMTSVAEAAWKPQRRTSPPPRTPTVTVSTSKASVPEFAYAQFHNPVAPIAFTGNYATHDGVLNSWRLDAGFQAGTARIGDLPVRVVVDGFRAFGADSAVPVGDVMPDMAHDYGFPTLSLGPTVDADTLGFTMPTERRVDYWSGAMTVVWDTAHFQGLRPKLGIGVQQLDQAAIYRGQIKYSGISGSDSYDEFIGTRYVGAFSGFDWRMRQGRWFAIVDARAGLYWASTDYRGTQVATLVGGGTAATAISLSDDGIAFIGTLRGEAGYEFDEFRITGWARADYISNVPTMAYETVFRSSGYVDPNVKAAAFGHDEMWSYSVGARFAMPLGVPPAPVRH